MIDSHRNKILIVSMLMLIVSACGSTSLPQENISTAVAQTVQAQNSLTKIADMPTITPAPPLEIIATAESIVTTNTSAPVLGAPGCTVSARLAGENPPDGALLKTGEYFWKTWSLENTGTCSWDSTYQLVYWSGDLMGGLTSYPLPEAVAPGETKDISIYLRAPDVDGTATGYWSIQTPWNTYFGAGVAGDPFYVQVNVTSAVKPKYEIISVTYKVVRDPEKGCPRKVWYTVYATITTNGPYEFDYYWDQSDGNESGVKTLEFTEAGSKTFTRQWLLGPGVSTRDRWMMIIVTAPVSQEYGKAIITFDCLPQ